ncbi:MAG: 3-isopropylmalate dehydrogenase [Pseudomonadota bacterium]
MTVRLVALPGDGIGPEVVDATIEVLSALADGNGLELAVDRHLIGGAAIDETGDPLPAATLQACIESHGVLLGAVGGPKWDDPSASVRPEQGLLRLRQGMEVFANLRPTRMEPALADASPLKPDRLEGVDLLVVRELTGGIYFGEKTEGSQSASDLCSYHAGEIERVVRLAGDLARQRRGHLTLVDKANVLATSRLWRSLTTAIVGDEYPDLTFDTMLVDAAAMTLVTRPAFFDVMVTENMFGDILTDETAAVAGSLGVLPSASLAADGPGLYEPIHGSAPDIAGLGKANPMGTMLSAALWLERDVQRADLADELRAAVSRCIAAKQTTADVGGALSTSEVASAVRQQLGQSGG